MLYEKLKFRFSIRNQLGEIFKESVFVFHDSFQGWTIISVSRPGSLDMMLFLELLHAFRKCFLQKLDAIIARAKNPRMELGRWENPSFFYCQDCNYKTKCKDYLVDHRRLMHNQTGNGQYICISGKCSKKPISFPNQSRLDKHKTCHASEKCEECGKIFGAKRNLKRHEKKKHQKEQVEFKS